MPIRPLPDFLKKGDKELGFPHPNPDKPVLSEVEGRMRQMIGMGEPERPVPEFVRSAK